MNLGLVSTVYVCHPRRSSPRRQPVDLFSELRLGTLALMEAQSRYARIIAMPAITSSRIYMQSLNWFHMVQNLLGNRRNLQFNFMIFVHSHIAHIHTHHAHINSYVSIIKLQAGLSSLFHQYPNLPQWLVDMNLPPPRKRILKRE